MLGALVLAVAAFVIGAPLTRSHYPPLMDLPFHAAAASILRHYGDPAFHFREQFALHFMKVPYWTLYGLSAALALPFSIVTAMKLAMFLMLAALPAGLATLFWGMKKSPLLGAMLGLVWVWNNLTQLGFLNFVAAIGVFCAAVGVTLRLVDEPTRKRQAALALLLLLIFATHIFRFPLAVLAVLAATALSWPATRRWQEPLLALVPSALLFAVWYVVRDRDGTGPENIVLRAFTWNRLQPHLLRKYLFTTFRGPEEARDAQLIFIALAIVFALGLVGFLVERRWAQWTRRERLFQLGATAAVAICALGELVLYLRLPLVVGAWWYVYPRELLAVALLVTALIPDLPRLMPGRAALLALIALVAVKMTTLVAREYGVFAAQAEDFRAISQQLPQSPRLAYLIFDHSGTDFFGSPFMHLPAWIQAEKGGWLSFHFVSWNQGPLRYRVGSPDVPPPTPPRFEFTPERFDVATRGKFFDWFLVRSLTDPSAHLAADPQIHRVAQIGRWWLYQRQP